MTKPPLKVQELTRAGFQQVGCWELSSERKLTHKIELPIIAGVYAFAVDGVVQYVGLASKSVRQRLGFYRKPGAGQVTNLRLNEVICGRIDQGAIVEIWVAHPPDFNWNGLRISGSEGLEAGLIAEFDLPWNVRGAAKPARFVPSENSAKTNSADRILEIVRRRPGMTELDIARAMYGNSAVQQQVNQECRLLLKLRLVERLGVGGKGDPFTYRVTANTQQRQQQTN